MIKVLLCDADGVTITPPGFGSAYAAKQAGLDVTELQPFFSKEFVACKQGKADLKNEIKPYLERIGWVKSVDEFLKIWFSYEHVIDERMIAEIETLKRNGVFCALTTDQEKYRKEYVLDEMHFQHIFDTWYISSDIGYAKHQQEYFEYVFTELNKHLSVTKDDVLLIDDTPSVIDAARQFGFHAELYTDFDSFETIKNKYNI